MLANMYLGLLVMFLVGLYSFFLKGSHFFVMLLSLEMLSMITFISLFCLLWNSSEKYVLIYYLTMCVCEGAFGLSILVSLIRSAGNDYLQSLMSMKC